jgi:hypothetical protein
MISNSKNIFLEYRTLLLYRQFNPHEKLSFMVNVADIKNASKLLPLVAFTVMLALLPCPGTAEETNPGAALFPLDWVPARETKEEIIAREARLEKAEKDWHASLRTAKESGKLAPWLQAELPVLKSRGRHAVRAAKTPSKEDDDAASGGNLYGRAHRLLGLTRFAVDDGRKELQPLLIEEFRTLQEIAIKSFLVERQIDIDDAKKARASGEEEDVPKYLGYPFDLNTVQPFNAILISAAGMKLLGEYKGEFADHTEELIETYVENKGRFTGSWLSGGYNKEVFHMEIGGWVEFLYAENPEKYPVARKTFSVCWDGFMWHYGYDGDNSPHYDAGTGIPSLMRTAYFLGRLGDLRKRDDFRRITWRMAHTVMNSGESAKWGKSMGEPFVSAGDDLPWTLKMGYQLFRDPLLLHVARKYEDRLMRERESKGQATPPSIYPQGINAWDQREVAFPADEPMSLTTQRLTHVDGDNLGNRIGRGDKKTGLVQDKIILRTGTHPQAPYFLMDLSFSQSKHAADHRIGIDNLIFDTCHVCTYSGRPGNGNQINQPLICPTNIPFPLVPADPGEVNPSKEYLAMVGRSAKDGSYKLRHFAATNISPQAAYGVADYAKFQQEGASVRREVVLLNNGVMVVLDTIATESNFPDGFNAGVIYQVWPGVEASDPSLRWVLQAARPPTAPELARERKGFPTLYLFPESDKLEARLAADPMNPGNKTKKEKKAGQEKIKTYSVHGPIGKSEKIVIPSIIAPIRDASKAADFAKSVEIKSRGGDTIVGFPTSEGGRMEVSFHDGKSADVRIH